jgi:hypothetical protein
MWILDIFRKEPEPIKPLEWKRVEGCGNIFQSMKVEAPRTIGAIDKNFCGNLGYARLAGNLSSVNHPIKNLGLSTRGENVLKAANIKTIRELLIYTRYELLQLKHCGKLTADEIEFQLEERYNVKLRPVTFR